MEMWWILLDIIVVIVMFWYIRSSAKKGFAKVVLEMAAFFAAYFLASDMAKCITGTELVVDGGMLAQLVPNLNRKLWEK